MQGIAAAPSVAIRAIRAGTWQVVLRRPRSPHGPWLPGPADISALAAGRSDPEGRYGLMESLSYTFLVALVGGPRIARAWSRLLTHAGWPETSMIALNGELALLATRAPAGRAPTRWVQFMAVGADGRLRRR